MRIYFKDIVDRHLGLPCAITAHGPSLNLVKDEIIAAHDDRKILRFSVNNWWDYFQKPPDYWTLSTTVFTMEKIVPILNRTKTTVFYSDDGDFTSKKLIEEALKSDWLAYDQRHWEGKSCLDILGEFKEHYEGNKNFSFTRFGNNETMWYPPRCFTNSGHALDGRCCAQNIPPRRTIQEELQALSGLSQHYSTGDTVSVHAIAFAIIMGCNPIYITGMDLDYNKGYANPDKTDWKWKASSPNAWAPVRENLRNDFHVLNESAKRRGIKIINLNEDSWYDEFEFGKFEA